MSILIAVAIPADEEKSIQFWECKGILNVQESYSVIYDLHDLWNDKPHFDTFTDRLLDDGFEEVDPIDYRERKNAIEELIADITVNYDHFFSVEICRSMKVCEVQYYQRIDIVAELKTEGFTLSPKKQGE